MTVANRLEESRWNSPSEFKGGGKLIICVETIRRLNEQTATELSLRQSNPPWKFFSSKRTSSSAQCLKRMNVWRFWVFKHGIFPFVHAVSAFIPPTFVSRKISPVGIGKFSMNVMVLANHSDVNCDDESKIDSIARLNPAIYIYTYIHSEVVC